MGYEDEERLTRRMRSKKPRPAYLCEFCNYDDQDELKKCQQCSKYVCKNPTCRSPHNKGTCSNEQNNQRNTNRGPRPHNRSR